MEFNQRARRWVITLQDPSESRITILENYLQNDIVKYAIYSKEIAPTTGMYHVHVYIHFTKLVYKNTIKSAIGSCWLEAAKGTELKNILYIQKDGHFKEFGEKTAAASEKIEKENNLKDMLNDLLNMNWNDFEAKYTTECYKNKNRLLQWKMDHRKILGPWGGELPKKNLWLWGDGGTGKSKWAHNLCPENKTYIKNTTKWWEGYDNDNTKLVIIEDFPRDKGDWLINIMKIWCDRYGFPAEIKGGSLWVDPGKWILVVTSNHSIDDVFQNSTIEDRNAIKRRFTEYEMKEGDIIQWAVVSYDELFE